ncbi:MAG: cytochrome c family protein [Caulobacter sp.]|nr:cytochrome c family protein [Caulobacter sp.]
MSRPVLMAITVLAASALSFPLLAAAPAPAGDAQAGQRAFAICASCHSRAVGEPARLGPNLAGVFGKKAGTNDAKFAYSSALKTAAVSWNDRNLDAWLARPNALVPGTKMAFAGVADPKTRSNIVAYLKTLGR